MSQTFTVEGMACQGCRGNVEAALTNLAGVDNVHVELESKQVHVNYDHSVVSADVLKAAVAEAGYTLVD